MVKASSQHMLEDCLPDVVCGDFDSIRPEVKEFYSQARDGILVDQSFDQETTDFEKCLKLTEGMINERGISLREATVLAAGALGGRLDHTLGNLHALHKNPQLETILQGDGNLVRLIHPGKSKIKINTSVEGPTCGLIPLYGPVMATTDGLQWNLDHSRLDFTGQVSTCNRIVGDTVSVDCDGFLLWTIELDDAAMEQSLLQGDD